MKVFKQDKESTERIKWIIYIIIDLIVINWLINHSDWWVLLIKVLTIPIIINLIFDLYYLKKSWNTIKVLTFKDDRIVLEDSGKTRTEINYKNLEYSIRKSGSERKNIEIDIINNSKTLYRLHVKNWNELHQIEEELESKNIERKEWVAKTFWGRNGELIGDLIFDY